MYIMFLLYIFCLLTLSKWVPLEHISGINSARENGAYFWNDDRGSETLVGQSPCEGIPITLQNHQRTEKKVSNPLQCKQHAFTTGSTRTYMRGRCPVDLSPTYFARPKGRKKFKNWGGGGLNFPHLVLPVSGFPSLPLWFSLPSALESHFPPLSSLTSRRIPRAPFTPQFPPPALPPTTLYTSLDLLL